MKCISVYDAVKLAEAKELHVVRGGEHLMNSISKEIIGRSVPSVTPLLAHFFNHGPALLAMLEEFVKLQEPFRKQLDANETEILDESIALIAKASKVEVEE